MEKLPKWDYRSLSLLFAGVLGLVAQFSVPELKLIFCSTGATFVQNAPPVDVEN